MGMRRSIDGTHRARPPFSKPLMMIFRGGVSPDARSRGADRDLTMLPRGALPLGDRADVRAARLRPAIRTVLRVATGMRVLQAGSLHAYLGYVIALVVSLVLFVWWTS